MRLEYYFDFSCPFAYLGSVEVENVARRTGAELVWRPMLLGGVLRAVGAETSLSKEPAAKRQESAHDMRRWAEVRGLPLATPPGHPQRTVRALRTILAVEEARWPALIHALYRSYWEHGESIEEEAVIANALEAAGISGDAARSAMAAAEGQAVKDELRRRTDEAVERGVFGAPTMFVGDQMFWGQDRLAMVEAALRGDSGPALAGLPDAPRRPNEPATIQFWYDFSSPFSYLAATQVEAVAARTGARLEWKPMLLGGVFKAIGTADAPILSMSESKRRYMWRDLDSWARAWQVPFRWNGTFPLRTVTALRVALLAGDRIAEVSHALFRAAWADDRNLDDPSVLASALAPLGLDADDLLARTRNPDVKQTLIDLTSEAVSRGVFGAPTFFVTLAGRERRFWGQDRLGLVERAAAGIDPPTL